MPTRNVSLTDHFDRFVEENVETGRYQNASEVVREGLRLLERQQQELSARMDRLRAAIDVGEEAVERGAFVDVEVQGLGDLLGGLGATGRRSTKD